MMISANHLIQIYASYESLSNKEMDLRTACIVAKNLNELSAPKQIIDDKRNKLIEIYGDKDSNGNLKSDNNGGIKISDIENFKKELSDLLSQTIDVDILHISKNSLSELRIAPNILLPLLDYLDEE